MNADKKLLQIEPRIAPACGLCGAKNTDTRAVTIQSHDGGNVASFQACRSCVKRLALDIAAAWFDFGDVTETKTPENPKR